MRKSVASLIVSVASLSFAGPCLAYSGSLAPSSASIDYTAYYDGAYGPFYNGYWTETSHYYYSSGPGRPFVRDDQRHFRRVMVTGFHPVEGFGPASASDRDSAARAESLMDAHRP